MDYRDFITDKSVVIGDNFKALIQDPDQFIEGFYLSLSDIPELPVLSELEDLITYTPPNPLTERPRDKVEEIYSKSFVSSWIPLTTTETLTGVEMYVDLTRFPLDYFALSDTNKYTRWFLGYKNRLTNQITPFIYGHDTRSMIKIDVKNTINFNFTYKCGLELITTPEKSYVDDLEFNRKDDLVESSEFYRLAELDYKYKNTQSNTLSHGVGSIKKGKLKFYN